MEIERAVASLEGRTEAVFGKPVEIETLGAILADATRLWTRQSLIDGYPVVRGRDHISDFPSDLLARLGEVIRTLEWAFDGQRDDEVELIKRGQVQIDTWDKVRLAS